MTNIRPYIFDDGKHLGGMLLEEGLMPERMCFVKYKTFVYDDGEVKGFYTYKIAHDIFPHMIHFCVGREHRTLTVARALIRDFRQRMRADCFPKAIIHNSLHKDYLDKIIRWYFKTEPYSENKTHRYFLVEV